MIFSAPTVSAQKRTLMGTPETWRELLPRLAPPVALRVNQQLMKNAKQPLVRIDCSPSEAAIILDLANKG